MDDEGEGAAAATAGATAADSPAGDGDGLPGEGGAAGPPEAPGPAAPPPSGGKSQRWKWIAGGAAVLVVLIVLSAAFGAKNNKKSSASSPATPHTTATSPHSATPNSAASPPAGTSTPSSATSSAPPKTSASTAQTTATPAPAPATPATPAAIAPFTVSGSGQQVSKKFTVAGGLTEFASACKGCSANFAVKLLDATGSDVDLLVNEIGAYSGSTAEGLPAGDYLVDVTADAPWSVTVTQPRGAAPAALPQTYSGKGDTVVGPFAADAAFTVEATNTGQANFVVKVLSADGQPVDLVFNEIGDFTGSTVAQTTFTSGPYYLTVTSDGTWHLTLSKP